MPNSSPISIMTAWFLTTVRGVGTTGVAMPGRRIRPGWFAGSLLGNSRRNTSHWPAQIEKEAEAIEDEESKKAQQKRGSQLMEKALSLRQLRRIERILDFATSFVGITGEEWGRSLWLLGVKNGVVNLQTGELTHGKPLDYIRSIAPTRWEDLDAVAPRWERFIREIFDEEDSKNPELSRYSQRLLGYGTTGSVEDHVVPIFHGPGGRNGKDTLLSLSQKWCRG